MKVEGEGEQWNWRFCALLSWRRSPRYTKASPSETDTKSAPLERICTICEERFCWSWELEERESRRGRLGAGLGEVAVGVVPQADGDFFNIAMEL